MRYKDSDTNTETGDIFKGLCENFDKAKIKKVTETMKKERWLGKVQPRYHENPSTQHSSSLSSRKGTK